MGTKISSKLPDHEDNGLDTIAGLLVTEPDKRYLAIVVLGSNGHKVEHTKNGDVFTPTAGVVAVEPVIDSQDINTLTEIIGRVQAARLGKADVQLDFGVEDPSDLDNAATAFLRNASGVDVTFLRGATNGGNE